MQCHHCCPEGGERIGQIRRIFAGDGYSVSDSEAGDGRARDHSVTLECKDDPRSGVEFGVVEV